MTDHSIKKLLILGAIIVSGIIFIQGYWTYKNWQFQENDFNQQVHIALRKVAQKLANYNNTKLPKQNLIQRLSTNYYAVNIDDEIDANILEDFLIREFESISLNTDFEYAVYDCQNDDLVYGNYCDIGENNTTVAKDDPLPKFKGLEYYFVVRFPSKSVYLIRSLGQSLLFSLITLLALLFFIYTTFLILRQKRLSEMQKDFINNMTHEFKTPISSMKIAADVLERSPLIQGEERLKKYVGIIRNQNVRLNQQVEKVLDIARIEKDALKLDKEKVQLTQLVQEVVDSFRLKVNNISGSISYNHPREAIYIEADRLHLSNVIHNIIDNATKYHKGKPHIEIELQPETKMLIVKDNGIGIPSEHLNNLFNKFFRVPTGNLHNVKGFGLGLYYVKNICSAHKWQIDVHSEERKGTTVKIKF